MDAKFFRQQQKRQIAVLSITSVAMLAIFPAFPALANGVDGTSARVTQHIESLSSTDRAKALEESLSSIRTDLADYHSNHAISYQIGERNSGSINQIRTGNHAAGNVAWLYQNGKDNSADISQSGSSHIGTIHQQGDELSASINQAGNGFGAAIYQTGLNAEATIKQSGITAQGISIEQFSRSGTGMNVMVTTH